MLNGSIKFWTILLLAVLLAVLSIGLVLKFAKAMVWLLVLIVLIPVFYFLLWLLWPKSNSGEHDKLKHRD